MPIIKNLAAVGVARQTAGKGTPATQPDFYHGLRAGTAFEVAITQSEEERTLATGRAAPEVNRERVVHGMKFTARVHPRAIGLYLYAALGSIATVTGTPNTHTITPGADVPYLTFWGLYAGEIKRVQDCKIDQLAIKWSGPGKIEIDVTAIGCIPGFPGSITPVQDEQRAVSYQAGGGTFTMDAASATPAAANITDGQLAINNNLAPLVLATSVVPQDVIIGHQSISPDLTIVPNDLAEWRKILTGSSSGTSISEQPIYGSYEQLFVIDANTSLKLTCLRAAFACPFPSVDPKGGAADIPLTATAVEQTGGGVACTAVVKNAHAAY